MVKKSSRVLLPIAVISIATLIFIVCASPKSINVNDSQRVYHEGGFSMACPTGWTTEKLIELPNPGIKNAMYFRSNNSSDIHIFSVEQYITRPSLRFDRYNQKEEWTKDNVTFQDHIATRYRFYSPGVVFDSKSQCGVYFVFENHDLWYKIGYRNYGFGNSIPDAVIDILDSFEVNCPCPELLSSVPKPKTGVLVQEF